MRDLVSGAEKFEMWHLEFFLNFFFRNFFWSLQFEVLNLKFEVWYSSFVMWLSIGMTSSPLLFSFEYEEMLWQNLLNLNYFGYGGPCANFFFKFFISPMCIQWAWSKAPQSLSFHVNDPSMGQGQSPTIDVYFFNFCFSKKNFQFLCFDFF